MGQPSRTAIVTGAARGIGAVIAKRLAADGAAIVANYVTSEAEALALVAEIKGADGRAIAVKADMADPGAASALFDAAIDEFGSVDVLVNNAGVMQMRAMADTDDAAFERHVSTNLAGVFRGMREAARRLRDGGRIISFSSSVVGLYQPGYG